MTYSKMRGALAALTMFATMLFVATPVTAYPGQFKREYKRYYVKVVHKFDTRTPGRHIVKYGVKTKKGSREATRPELKRSIRTFKRWLAPPPAPVAPGDRAPSTASVASTPHYAGGRYSIPSSIVMCESGGNYRAVNPNNPNRPAGAYQIITSTWIGAGGGKYAPTADAATPAQQDEIASRIWAGGSGRGNWAC